MRDPNFTILTNFEVGKIVMHTIDKFYQPIGHLVIRFQELDFTLNIMLMSLIKEDPNVTMAFSISLSFRKKIDVIKSIAPFKITNAELHHRLDTLINKLINAEEVRNKIIHTYWTRSSVEKKVFRLKPKTNHKKGLTGGGYEAKLSDIEDAIKTVDEAVLELFHFCAELERKGIMPTRIFGVIKEAPSNSK